MFWPPSCVDEGSWSWEYMVPVTRYVSCRVKGLGWSVPDRVRECKRAALMKKKGYGGGGGGEEEGVGMVGERLASKMELFLFLCFSLSQHYATCVSRTDLLRQFYMMDNWDRSYRSNTLSHPAHITQTSGQPVLALTLQGPTPGRVTTRTAVFKSLV